MRNRILSVLLVFLFPFALHAQLGRFIDKTKNKVQQRIDNQYDRAVDQTLDKMEGKEEARTGETQSTPAPHPQEKGLASYSRYDFVPGERIIYAEDFGSEAIGELPLNWNTGGKAEVVTLNTVKDNWLRLYQNAVYLTANRDSFSRDFTIEFDVVLDMKPNGWLYPEFHFGFLSSNQLPPNDNSLLREYDQFAAVSTTVFLGEGGATRTRVESYLDNRKTFYSDVQGLSALENFYGRPAHVSLQVQDKRLRIWFNGEKKFDLPMAVPAGHPFNQLFFRLSSSNYKDDMLGFYIGHLKVAAGKPDTRHKLVEDGKFSTTGILFDVQRAELRPESFGVIREVAAVLKANSGIRIKIIGHTSNDGDDTANLELSRLRAASVKEALIREGIDGSRMDTEGKGEQQPVADNKTREGRTQNRRVEFVKL